MSFADLKGQDSAVSFLRSSLKNGRISHAYIFFGPDGVGKRIAAINFAKALNCANASEGEGCDICPSCKKIESLSHPDISIVRAEKEGGSIKIDDVRSIIKDAYLKPFEARKKVYIIDGAEDLKHEAANALLKTLEEPPQDAVIILITDNLKALFQTIVSRSQIVRFFPLKTDEMVRILNEEHALDQLRAGVLSRLSSGSIGKAVKFNDEDLFGKRDSIISSVSGPEAGYLDFEDLPKDDLRLYMDILLTWFGDILSEKTGVRETLLVNIDKKDIIFNEARRLSFEYLEETISNIVRTFTYLDQNANQKLAMNVLAMKINQVTLCMK